MNSVLLYLKTMRLSYSSMDELCDDHKGAEAVTKMKREMNMSLNQHQALPKHTMLTKLKSFYAYSTGEHHKESICHKVLVLFHLKM